MQACILLQRDGLLPEDRQPVVNKVQHQSVESKQGNRTVCLQGYLRGSVQRLVIITLCTFVIIRLAACHWTLLLLITLPAVQHMLIELEGNAACSLSSKTHL